jgi:hypothetical protein
VKVHARYTINYSMKIDKLQIQLEKYNEYIRKDSTKIIKSFLHIIKLSKLFFSYKKFERILKYIVILTWLLSHVSDSINKIINVLYISHIGKHFQYKR